MRESDVFLFVVDAQPGMAPIDQELASMLRKSRKPVVLVINKIDHPNHEALEADFARLIFKRLVPISAAHGRGFRELIETIDALLPTRKTATPNVRRRSPTSRSPSSAGRMPASRR